MNKSHWVPEKQQHFSLFSHFIDVYSVSWADESLLRKLLFAALVYFVLSLQCLLLGCWIIYHIAGVEAEGTSHPQCLLCHISLCSNLTITVYSLFCNLIICFIVIRGVRWLLLSPFSLRVIHCRTNLSFSLYELQ